MAHFAKLDENNIVTDVITFSNQEVIDNGGDLSVEAENFVFGLDIGACHSSLTSNDHETYGCAVINLSFTES